MSFEASEKSAALAGAWSALGLFLLDSLIDHFKGRSDSLANVLWLLMMLAFFFVPGYLFVLGRNQTPFGPLWFLRAEERARYGPITKRMFIWFVSAGFVMICLSAVTALLGHRA
jgi:hypothetical protein